MSADARQRCVLLADYDAVGVGVNLDRPPDPLAVTSIVIVEAHQAGLETDAGTAWNPSNRPA